MLSAESSHSDLPGDEGALMGVNNSASPSLLLDRSFRHNPKADIRDDCHSLDHDRTSLQDDKHSEGVPRYSGDSRRSHLETQILPISGSHPSITKEQVETASAITNSAKQGWFTPHEKPKCANSRAATPTQVIGLTHENTLTTTTPIPPETKSSKPTPPSCYNIHHTNHETNSTYPPSDAIRPQTTQTTRANQAFTSPSLPSLNHADSISTTAPTNCDAKAGLTTTPPISRPDEGITGASQIPSLTSEHQRATLPPALALKTQKPLEAPPSLASPIQNVATASFAIKATTTKTTTTGRHAPDTSHRVRECSTLAPTPSYLEALSVAATATATNIIHGAMKADPHVSTNQNLPRSIGSSNDKPPSNTFLDSRKRKESQELQGKGTSSPPRHSELPLGLRNKKMKPTDCLLFAATLLEEDDKQQNAAAVDQQPRGLLLVPKSDRSTSCPEDDLHHRNPDSGSDVPSVRHGTSEVYTTPRDVDVLCGRGGLINKHPGNIVYRKVVDYNKPFYQSVHKKHRILVSQSIVQTILNFGGRFLISGAKGKSWMEIGFKRAVQKTSQALRERVANSEDDDEEGTKKDEDRSHSGVDMEDDDEEDAYSREGSNKQVGSIHTQSNTSGSSTTSNGVILV